MPKRTHPPRPAAPSAAEPANQKAPDSGREPKGAALKFPIVGIGASAGGLEALEQFFAGIPGESGLAFIVVPHLDPSHASMMTDLLGRVTRMPVAEAADGLRVEPGRVYVIPPNKDLTIQGGVLKLTSPQKSRGLRLPIDSFFRSLADDQGENAIAIIFSGTGSDGTLGIQAIHWAGGISLVQDPETARYSGMPSSAIQTGLADFVLPVDRMAEHLRDYLKQAAKTKIEPSLTQKTETDLRRILGLVRLKTGHDLTQYKRNTLFRRLEKRMALRRVQGIGDYISYLQEHAEEVRALFKDMLIGVTNFFRDPVAFEVLGRKILPDYLAAKPQGYSLRIWVPACGTGEEAYSLAMTAAECSARLRRDLNIQVFGTDVDEDSIAVARAGVYASNVAADVKPAFLGRYFYPEGSHQKIRKEIRDMVVFAVQDVLKDPPFTKLDFLSCRNLLIYLEPELQSRMIPSFHYSLKPGGLLFLGPSETVGQHAELFDIVDKRWKIYAARKIAAKVRDDIYQRFPWSSRARPEPGPEPRLRSALENLPERAQKILLGAFAPPSVIVDEKGHLLYTHGQLGRYLDLARGGPGLNIQDMAREGLRVELKTGLRESLAGGKEKTFRGLRIETGGAAFSLDLILRPLSRGKDTHGLILVTFEEVPMSASAGKEQKPKARASRPDKRFGEMERELADTRSSLKTSVEELQASNEELKSANEELQSTNEELQSTNEELDTSREELQSMNEELVTLNAELQSKIDQLTQTENEMRILLENTRIGIVFLDVEMRIQRFTSEATKVFSLINSDLGRPLTDIRSQLEYDSLIADILKVEKTLQPRESEVLAKDGASYLLKIIPYRSAQGELMGVVLTFTDVTHLKRPGLPAAPAPPSRDVTEYAEGVVETVRQPMLVLDEDLRVVSANGPFYEMFGLSKEALENRRILDVGDREWDLPALKKLVVTVLPRGKSSDHFEIEREFPGIGRKRVLFKARKITLREIVSKPLILLAVEDLNENEDAPKK